MRTFNSINAFFYREFKISFNNIYDILSLMLFFIMGIFIFVFSIGPDKIIFQQIGVGIIWTLLVFTTNLSLRKFYHDDFNDGNIFLYHMSGLSFELIVLIKVLAHWIFVQIPFLFIIIIGYLILNLETNNIYTILLTFFIGSPILILLASISGSMNLLNNRNSAIGSIVIMILSIPLIIFSVSISSTPEKMIIPQLSILISILLFFLAITPWISAGCIKIAMKNK